MKNLVYCIWLFLFLPVNAFAEKLATNIENVFIKNIVCYNSFEMKLTVSNKGTKKIETGLIITVFDEDNDPIDNIRLYIVLGPISGDGYFAKVSCSDKYRFAFRFE
jgi:hypothetical protein